MNFKLLLILITIVAPSSMGQEPLVGPSIAGTPTPKDENETVEMKKNKKNDLKARMERMESKSQHQENEIEVLKTLLEEEKKFSKQLSARISYLEGSTNPDSVENDLPLGRPKRPYRLLPPKTSLDNDNKNMEKSRQFYGPASNCDELGQLGYTLNGYFLVKKATDSTMKGNIGIVYCRFQQRRGREQGLRGKPLFSTSVGGFENLKQTHPINPKSYNEENQSNFGEFIGLLPILENEDERKNKKMIPKLQGLSKIVNKLQSNDIKNKNEMAQFAERVSRLESLIPFKEKHPTESNQENWVKPTIPTSCKDLLKIGHVMNGFYSVLTNGKIQLVFCNFHSKKNQNMETPVGVMDIKSSPVYFYFQKSNIRHSVYNVPMPFEIKKLNVGNAMNMATGIFTAPKAGIYYFAYNGIKDAYADATDLYLQLNGNKTAVAHATNVHGGLAMALHATLKLQAGDKISLVLSQGVVHDFFNNFSSFVGWLLEEHDFVM